MEEKKTTKIFLVLPEYPKPKPTCFPTTEYYYNHAPKEYVIMNVYEHYRNNGMDQKKATILSMSMISAFDEVWLYSAFGITKPMADLVQEAKHLNKKIRELSLDCEKCFGTVYQIATQFHPILLKQENYWDKFFEEFGKQTKDKNPLTHCLLIALEEYFDSIFHGQSPIPKENNFKAEFRTALNFAKWVLKSNIIFQEDFKIEKISKSPTPMLQALVSGFQNYYNIRKGVVCICV